MKYEKELRDSAKPTTTATDTKQITPEEAKTAALTHAGVSANAVRNYQCESDTERGISVYEIEFEANGMDYDYEINATTGAVIKVEKEIDD